MHLPTVAIHHPLDTNVMMLINAVDYRESEHVMWVEPVPSDPTDLRIQKGARGLWFVKRDGEAVSKGFATEAEADAEMVEMRA